MNSLNKITPTEVYDVIIIGSGPAGLTCAIYAARGNLNVCIVDKGAPGGKMTSTYQIENWSGEVNIKGYELSQKMLNHVKALGVKNIFGQVSQIEHHSEFEHYTYLDNGKIIQSKAIVIATGMINKKPNIAHFESYEHKGVSYCVVCDASFYKGKPAAIIGGGDSAFDEAIYLASIASQVYIFVRKPEAKAESKLIEDVKKIKNIEVLYNAKIVELIGQDQLEQVRYIQNDKEYVKEINHLYPYIGFLPSNQFVHDQSIFDQNGFIKTNENMETEIPGLFAIGDIRPKSVRQIVTAAADGAIAGKVLTNKIK